MTLIHTRKTKLIFNDPIDFIPYLQKYFKSFKKLTPIIINRIKDEILIHESIRNNIFDILKKTLRLGSGSIKPNMMQDLLGWSDEELQDHNSYMSNRHISKLIKIGKTKEEAKEEYAEQQRIGSRRSLKYWMKLGFNEHDSKIKLNECQASSTKKHKDSLSNNEYSEFKKKSSKRCIEYWINKGNTEEEAKNEITKAQSKVSKRCKEYWINRGYSQDDACKAVTNYQKSSLDNKTKDEIIEINKKKANGFGFNNYWNENLNDVQGVFYVIKLNENLHKIGITSKSLITRYGKENLINKEIVLEHRCDSIQHAFEIEQLIKRDFKDTINKNDYGPFGWTEVLNTNFDAINGKFNHYINNREEVKQKFRALRKKNEDNTV